MYTWINLLAAVVGWEARLAVGVASTSGAVFIVLER